MSEPPKTGPVRAEDAPMLDNRQRKHLKAIWRRLNYLSYRISEHTGDPSHDRAERAALLWLIDRAGVPAPPGGE